MKRNKKEDILLNTDNDDISMLAEIQTDPDEVTAMEFNKEIPVMPLRNMVMFPSVVMPVTIGRPSTLKLINAAYKKKLPIAVVCQIQGDISRIFECPIHIAIRIGNILRGVFEERNRHIIRIPLLLGRQR
jgi:ATP-dependent Lon protease